MKNATRSSAKQPVTFWLKVDRKGKVTQKKDFYREVPVSAGSKRQAVIKYQEFTATPRG